MKPMKHEALRLTCVSWLSSDGHVSAEHGAVGHQTVVIHSARQPTHIHSYDMIPRLLDAAGQLTYHLPGSIVQHQRHIPTTAQAVSDLDAPAGRVRHALA